MFGINLLNRGTVVHGGLNEFNVAEASDSLPEDGDVIRICFWASTCFWGLLGATRIFRATL